MNQLAKSIAIISTPISKHNALLCPRYNLLVTGYKAVDGFRNLVVRSQVLPKQQAKIKAFDPIYDVAFFQMPMLKNLNFEFNDFYLPNVGQHVRVMIRTVSRGVITANAVVLRFNERENIPFFQVRSDFSQKLAIGALVVDNDDKPLGIVVDAMFDERLEVLPYKNLIESIVDFIDYDTYAFRCPYCGEILTNETVSMGKCIYCGELLPEQLYIEKEYIPGRFESKVEKIIQLLNYNPYLSRLDKNFWEIQKSDIQLFIHYDEQNSSLVAYCQLFDLGKIRAHQAKKQQIYQFLLEQNSQLDTLMISTKGEKVMLSTIYLNLETLIPEQAVELLRELFAKAAQIKPRLAVG